MFGKAQTKLLLEILAVEQERTRRMEAVMIGLMGEYRDHQVTTIRAISEAHEAAGSKIDTLIQAVTHTIGQALAEVTRASRSAVAAQIAKQDAPAGRTFSVIGAQEPPATPTGNEDLGVTTEPKSPDDELAEVDLLGGPPPAAKPAGQETT